MTPKHVLYTYNLYSFVDELDNEPFYTKIERQNHVFS